MEESKEEGAVHGSNGVRQVEMTEEEQTKTVVEDQTKTVDDNVRGVDESATNINQDDDIVEAAPEHDAAPGDQDQITKQGDDDDYKEDTASEGEDQIRRVMFETDNWEDCITESIWFGQKIPQKKRFVGRQAHTQKDPVAAFFEEGITFAGCKQHLI